MRELEESTERDSISEFFLKLSSQLRGSNVQIAEWSAEYLKYHIERLVDDTILVMQACTIVGGSRIADVGSTPPLVSGYLSQIGKSVVGIDIDPYRITLPDKLNVKVCKYDVEDLSSDRLPGGPYDVVVLTEVIEHLRISPPSVLSKLNNSLAKGGVMVLSTPNLWSYVGIKNFLIDRRAEVLCSRPEIEYRKIDKLGHMGHVREYTYKEIKTLVESCGFKIIQESFRHYNSVNSRLEAITTKYIRQLRNNFALLAQKL